jgi:hypothetical protein
MEDSPLKVYFLIYDFRLGEREMPKKMFFGVLLAMFISGLLIVTIEFDATKATSYVGLGTLVGGYISANTVWTLDGSPYVVVSDVIVEAGVVLTINQGVTVKFTSGTSIIVDGALVADGNFTYPITFTSNSTTPAPGDWGSIRFRDSSDDALCIINYGVVRFGITGILAESSSPQIRYCNVSDNSENGIQIAEGAASVYRCFVSNNNVGILINGANASPSIAECEIRENRLAGVFCNWAWGWGGTISIQRNDISSNGGNGIFCSVSYNVLISDNVIFNNTGSGINNDRMDMMVSGNAIKNNNYGIIIGSGGGATGGVYPINHNQIMNNSLYDFHSAWPTNIDATLNWWGTTNETAINEHIYDYYDDYNIGKVIYKPFLVPPIANFMFSPETPYACGTVAFDASASFNPYGSIINYTWDFGDGNITTIVSPTINHSYAIPDTYNVILTVTDEFGLTNSTSTIITVLQDNIPPVTSDDYDGVWRTADFIITLIATDHESGVSETYYRINKGPVQNASANGQPLISLESANNTLEYWSVDNAGNEELPHKTSSGIKLDKTVPTIGVPSRIPEGDVEPGQEVKILVNITDSVSGVKNVTLSYNLNDSIVWVDAPMTFNSTMGLYETAIQVQQAHTLVKYKITAYDNAGNHIVKDKDGEYYAYTVIPEFPSTAILPLLMLTTLIATVLLKKKNKTKPQRPQILPCTFSVMRLFRVIRK